MGKSGCSTNNEHPVVIKTKPKQKKNRLERDKVGNRDIISRDGLAIESKIDDLPLLSRL